MQFSGIKKLLSFWFLFNLLLLLLNDFWWKAAFHNWFTGKLSDFSGLFVFSVTLSLVFKKQSKFPFVFTGILFVWWKSHWSSPFIGWWNTFDLISISRVIDYTDLVALLILLPAYSYVNNTSKILLPRSLSIPVLMLTLFSIVATSVPEDNIFEGTVINKTYELTTSIDDLRMELETLQTATYIENFTNGNNQTFGSVLIFIDECDEEFEYQITFIENDMGGTTLSVSDVLYTCQELEYTIDELTLFLNKILLTN